MFRLLKFPASIAAGIISLATQADAAILCDGNFQILRGAAISTPYCQDENLAALERKQGIRISGEAIRRSPDAKRQACSTTATSDEIGCAEFLGD